MQVEQEKSSAPKISVIMPVRNADKYVSSAIDSVLRQSFTDFEFLIHDDGSSDESYGIVSKYSARDDRIQVSSSDNLGIPKARNHLISRAKGELIAIMDADDVCLKDRFSKQYNFLLQNPEVGVLGSGALVIDELGRPIAPYLPPTSHLEIDYRNLSGQTAIINPSAMIRKSCLVRVGMYDERFTLSQDLEIWLRLGEICEIRNLPDVLIKYRTHEKSVSTERQERQRELARLACREAWSRRGLDMDYCGVEYRPSQSRDSRLSYYIKNGWDAWNWGYRASWGSFASKAVMLSPTSIEAWKLLILGWIRRPRIKRHLEISDD